MIFSRRPSPGGWPWQPDPPLSTPRHRRVRPRRARRTLPPFELEEATVAGLQQRMAAGELSSAGITRLYLERIAALDDQGPALGAVIETNPEAPAIAAALDAERKAGHLRGPLHGIPVLLKDNIDTGDRMMTTAGSYALDGEPAPHDAFVAARLRAAGAVILGKANLSEWANFRSSHSTSGWSGRGRQCHNPYALNRNPCGSSSGSGAGVSANFCAVAVGTETDGSVVCPSSANGVVGLKPTVGLVSRTGIIPISASQDTAGPMARTVTDAAILLGAMAGVDAADAATRAARGQIRNDYAAGLDPAALKGARIGVVRADAGFDARVDRLMEEALDLMRQAGAVIVDPVEIPDEDKYGRAEGLVLRYEFKAGLNAYFATRGPGVPVHSLEELIAFNEAHAKEELPYFGQELLIQSQKKGGLDSREYRDALKKCGELSRKKGLDVAFAKQRLDALVAPTGGPAWTTDLVNGDHFTGGNSTPAAVSGYPALTVPMGYIFGLPVGLTFMGKPWTEALLLRLGYAYEQARGMRKAPQFLPTADLAAP